MVWEVGQDMPDARAIRSVVSAYGEGKNLCQVTKPVPAARERLVSLDLLRGLAVIGMILVNEMAGMQSEGAVYPTPAPFALAGA